jgi:hypothetical protein
MTTYRRNKEIMSTADRKKLILIFPIFVILLGFTACADIYQAANRPKASPPPGPGLYSLNGWYGTRADVDINGEVGHPLDIGYPRANCVPSGNWSGGNRVDSGTLPPGMSMGEHGGISGLPSERGHWIVKMEMYNVQCGGSSYEGFTQTLRFHITGSGKVVE